MRNTSRRSSRRFSEPARNKGKSGAPGGIRTHDQLIKSQLLYQLSYRGNRLFAIHCDGLVSLEKSRLTDYVGELSETKKEQLDKALQAALALPAGKS